tara:strand:- start:250 stop:624 length:375 start_codon:yes stop_codon:yes gene_type:complete
MKLLRVETVASDAVVANTPFIVDTSAVNEIKVTGDGSGATTAVMTGAYGLLTFTVDGANAAEKVLNASKIAEFLAAKVAEMNGPHSTQKGIVDLFRGKLYANFETDSGIVNTGGTGPLVTIGLS